jgi:hypothetical protein
MRPLQPRFGGGGRKFEFVYGAPEFGDFQLITRGDGEQLIAAKKCCTWGDLARLAGQSWKTFAAEYHDELSAWREEWNAEEPIKAKTPLDAEILLEVYDRLFGLPEARAQAILQATIDAQTLARLADVAEFGGVSMLGAFGAVLLNPDQESPAAFQRILDESGYRRIRLVRDDEFVRKVYA